MAKPICIIKVDMEADFGGGKRANLYEWGKIFEERLPDYHVFVISQPYDSSEPKEVFIFQVFYEKDFTEIDYNGLKEIINRSLN